MDSQPKILPGYEPGASRLPLKVLISHYTLYLVESTAPFIEASSEGWTVEESPSNNLLSSPSSEISDQTSTLFYIEYSLTYIHQIKSPGVLSNQTHKLCGRSHYWTSQPPTHTHTQ